MENLPDYKLNPPDTQLYRCDVCDGYGYVSEPTQSDCLCVCHAAYRERENENPRERDYCHGCKEFHHCHFCDGQGERDYSGMDDPRDNPKDFMA